MGHQHASRAVNYQSHRQYIRLEAKSGKEPKNSFREDAMLTSVTHAR